MPTTASYPTGIASFGPDRIDLQSVVVASDVNPVYAEIVAIETTLGTAPNKRAVSWNTGSFNSNATTFASVDARIQNIENGVYSWSVNGVTNSGGGTILGTNGVNLKLKGISAQENNLLEFRTSNDTLVGYVSPAGKLEVVSIDGGSPSSNFA